MKKKIIIYPLRKESDLSGERYSLNIIKKSISQSGMELIDEETDNRVTSTFWSFFSLARFKRLFDISKKNNSDILIVKVPTASQAWWVSPLTFLFEGRIIILIDGIMWSTPRLKTFIYMLKNEFAVTVVRLILNNKLWSIFNLFFKQEIVFASNRQFQQVKRFINKKSIVNIIPNSTCDLEQYSKLNPIHNVQKFGYIGHSYPIKGIDILLETIREIAHKNENLEFHIALSGRGKQIDVNKFNLPNIYFYGKVDRDDFYSKVDCMIFPYLADWGTNVFPSVLLESLMKGKPLIVSDLPITKELFGESLECLSFTKVDSRPNLKQKIIETSKMKFTEQQLMGHIARFKERFSHDIVRHKWNNLLQDKI